LLALAGVCFIATAAFAFALGFVSPTPAVATPEELFVAGKVTDFAVDEPVYFKQGDFWLVKRPDGTFLALFARETRWWLLDASRVVRCPIRWRPEYIHNDWAAYSNRSGAFVGECSSSAFAIDGTRVFGPTPRDLDRRPVTVTAAQDVAVDIAKHRLVEGRSALWAR
jgi:hypothetical protein